MLGGSVLYDEERITTSIRGPPPAEGRFGINSGMFVAELAARLSVGLLVAAPFGR